jgi:hypothetical protein
MVPLYAAHVSDVGPGDYVKVSCIACRHETLIPPATLLHGLHLAPLTLLLDLEPKFAVPRVRRQGKGVRHCAVGNGA